MNRAFVVVCFGDRRRQLLTLTKSIDVYVPRVPVHLYTDHPELYEKDFDVIIHERKPKWYGHPRSAVRSSNQIKVQATTELKDIHTFCLIDDDMQIVSSAFSEGFELADKFGAVLPMNPRVYVKYLKQSADVSPEILEELKLLSEYTTACNFSPFFYCREITIASVFMRCLEQELLRGYRGTLAVWVAAYKSGYTPLYLPEQWCVCGDYAEHLRDYSIRLKGEIVPVSPICLHLGHDKVREVFDGYKMD